MAGGLMLEAIAARARREASSFNAYDGLLPAPIPRKRSGKSLNSRYDRDLGNIASFDRPPVKPTFNPRGEDTATEYANKNGLETYRYRANEEREVRSTGQSGKGNEGRAGKGGNGDIWRKLNVPVKPQNLDPNLENILFPSRSSSDTYVAKTLSPPDPNIYQYLPSYTQGGYQPVEQIPYPKQYPPPPPPLRPYTYPQMIQGYHQIPAPTQPHPNQYMIREQQQQQSYIPDSSANIQAHYYAQAEPPVQVAGGHWQNPAQLEVPTGNFRGPHYTHSDTQYRYPPSDHNQNHRTLPVPSLNTPRSRQSHPYLPLTQNHLPPQSDDFFSPTSPVAQHDRSRSSQDDPSHATTNQNNISGGSTVLTDPSAQPIPKYDHQLKQWVLVPQTAPQPTLTQANCRDDQFQRGQKRRADSSPHDLPPSLAMAFEDLSTPTRPRQPAVRPDMQGKKGGRDLIRSLENQVEESSSADELNLRSEDNDQDQEVDMVDQIIDNQGGNFVQDDPRSVKVSRQQNSNNRSRSRSVQQDDYMSNQPDYEMASQEASESDSQFHHQPHQSRSRHHSSKYQDNKRSRYHDNKRTRKRSHSLPHHTSKMYHNPKSHLHRSTRSIKQEREPSRRITNPSQRRSRHARRTHSPSSTESDSNSYSSGSRSETDSDNFTSPSNTPSSPSPTPHSRYPITRGAWGDYEVPANMLEYSDPRRYHPLRPSRRKVKSIPLSIHQRPRDPQGKFLPYAYTRSESPEQAIMAEEDEDVEDGEEIEGFTPSFEDRFSGIGARQGLSPVIEEDEEEDIDVEMESPREEVSKGSGKKKVRWRDDVKRHDATGKRGVNRLPKGWQLEFEGQEEDGEGENADDMVDENPEDGGKEEKTVTAKVGVSPFGEGFFKSDTAGEVGFQVWRDGV